MWEVNTFTYNIYIFTLYIIGIYSYYLRILFISIVYCLLLIIIDNIVVCFRFTIVSDFFWVMTLVHTLTSRAHRRQIRPLLIKYICVQALSFLGARQHQQHFLKFYSVAGLSRQSFFEYGLWRFHLFQKCALFSECGLHGECTKWTMLSFS